jgi:beta-fructofuranosidase
MKVYPTVSALALAMVAAQDPLTNFTPAEPGTPAFLKHRPVFHFLARKNWMNDPCGPYFDSDTGLYHMFYQSNTELTTWGNMTWGHAVSKDQVTWQDYPDALKNQDKWDNLGVFSGFARNKAIDGKDTVFYTGVTALPISWTLPYLFGEHVNYATTSDNGKTWQKGAKPVIELPPAGLNVTGWRDPNVFDNKALDKAFGIKSGPSYYLITAGGIHGVGSRIFLYHSTNYLDWDYKGFLLAKEKNTTFSPYSGNWGFNFETTNFVELTDAEGVTHNVMMFAAEGTPRRYPMWAVGDVEAPSSRPICGDGVTSDDFFKPKMVGVTEYSDWYANAVFKDPKSGKNVVWGWIVEDNGYEKQPQGWNGILSVPRTVDVAIIKDVYDPENKLDAPGDWMVTGKREVASCGGKATPVTAKTIKTVAFQPFQQLDLMRGDKLESVESVKLSKTNVEKVLASTGKSFELYAEVTEFEAGSKVGFQVRRSSAGDETTTIVYDDSTKKIVIDRSKSSSADCAPFTVVKPNAKNTEGWFHHYSTVQGSGETCKIQKETLKFRIYVDVSVIEVFVNDRFSISSRVYPCEGKTASDGISLVASGDATFANVKVWTNPKKAWADNRQIAKF